MKDFFEDLGKRISDVATDVSKKTGDVLEVQKIKGDIRSLKRANERDFIEMGQMIYEKFKDGQVEDMDYVALCEAIEKRDESAEKLQEEVDRIQETV